MTHHFMIVEEQHTDSVGVEVGAPPQHMYSRPARTIYCLYIIHELIQSFYIHSQNDTHAYMYVYACMQTDMYKNAPPHTHCMP